MFKYTKYLLDKLEDLFEELNYTLRYEKGTFQSGYCIVESQSVVVINRFFDTESRINCLLEILEKVEFDETGLSENAKKTLKKVQPVMAVHSTSE